MTSKETPVNHRPRVVNGRQDQQRDEIMHKFSKNMRKLMTSRDGNTLLQEGCLPSKSVTFNTETIETSFGGTQTPGRIKELSMIETVSGDCKVTDKMFSTSSINRSIKKPLFNGEKQHTNNGSKCGAALFNGEKPSENGLKSDGFLQSAEKQGHGDTQSNAITVAAESTKNRTPLNQPTEVEQKLLVPNTGQTKLAGTPAKLDHTILHRTPSPFLLKNRRYTLDTDPQATPDYYNPVAFETPAKGKPKQRWSSGDVTTEDEGPVEDSVSMTVAVRVRPFTQREEVEEKCIISMLDNETVVTTDRGDTFRFTYDYSFWSFDKNGSDFASQEEVYMRLARPMLGKAFEGYNTCLFAYGQTGSGKSYSIMGNDTAADHVGIVPRFCSELFQHVQSASVHDPTTAFNIEISYFEIYNEKIHDLLCPSTKVKTGRKPNLKVREHPVLGPYVEGLSSYVVNTFDDVKSWLNVGNKRRATAATGMNDKSSRSHSVFTTVLTQTKSDTIEGEVHEHTVTSKINLVDLAGSERQTLAKTSGDRLREGASINKSLHTLGKVISVLSEQGSKRKKLYVPYRDSVLTWLLKESVGGNSKTAMLATISPAARHGEETLSTLRYARQARNIVNKVRVNEDPKARLIRELKAEIEHMRLAMGTDGIDSLASWAEVTSLREQLALKEQEMRDMSRSWQERLQRSEEQKQEEARLLERSGVAFKVDSGLPNLVNLNEDPQLSEVLLYVLREGQTRVGRQLDDSQAEIQLVGPLIADSHCVITNEKKEVRITPVGDAPTYVNGDLITSSTELHHGDRVILGGDHYFRLNYPAEAQDKRNSGQFPSQPRDFEYAKQELTRVQNERLEQELEEARRRHEEEMAAELHRQQSKAQDEMQQLKVEADQMLTRQKSQYEDRLQELERLLEEQHTHVQQSDEHRLQAADVIKKLETEKMVLEQEVLCNRKRMELEAKASQQAVAESKQSHSLLLEQLQLEIEKIDSEVQRYESKKQLRAKKRAQEDAKAAAKVNGKAPLPGNGKSNLYRTFMLLREANKISQLLKKDTIFNREDKVVVEGGDPQPLVKVTNKKLRISTYWTWDKFEDKLIKMKELYEGEDENDENDDTFYDANDAWEKDDRLAQSPGLSPKLLTSIRRQCNPSVKSSLSSTPDASPRSPIFSLTESGMIPGKAQQPDKSGPHVLISQQLMSFYRDVITANMARFDDVALRESFADKILQQCESIKASVTSLLQAYNAAAEARSVKQAFYGNAELLTFTHRLEGGLSLLQTTCALWRAHAEKLNSGLIEELFDTVVTSVKKLSNHLVLFLQGCESDIDSMVQSSSSHVFSTLFTLCQCAGELSLATDTHVTSLQRHAEDGAACFAYGKTGVDVRQYFLKGCDKFIDRTLQGGVRSMDECETRLLACGDEAEKLKESTHTIVKQVELTVASCKILLEKLQSVQVELDSTLSIRESLQPRQRDSVSVTLARAPDYYVRSYGRCQSLIGHISNMADGVSLLTQATEHILKGTENTGLRRLVRCTEMIQKATGKILAASCSDTSLSDSQSDSFSGASVLTDSQSEQVSGVGQEVEFATNTLVVLIKRELELDQVNSPTKCKRILPLSPSVGSVRALRKQFDQGTGRKLATFDSAKGGQ